MNGIRHASSIRLRLESVFVPPHAEWKDGSRVNEQRRRFHHFPTAVPLQWNSDDFEIKRERFSSPSLGRRFHVNDFQPRRRDLANILRVLVKRENCFYRSS